MKFQIINQKFTRSNIGFLLGIRHLIQRQKHIIIINDQSLNENQKIKP